MRFVNVGTHFLLGLWTFFGCNDPRYRAGGLTMFLSFLVYQVVGAWRKGDQGWPEIKESMIGGFSALAANRTQHMIEQSNLEPDLKKVARVAAPIAIVALGAGVCYLIARKDKHG